MVKVGIVPRRRGTPGNRDFRLEAAAGTLTPLSKPVDMGSHLRHTRAAAFSLSLSLSLSFSLFLTHMHAHILQHPARFSEDSWQSSVYHPRQKARTCWAVEYTVPGSRKACTAMRE